MATSQDPSAAAPQPRPRSRKRLPVKPSEEHLRKQAKRRARIDGVALADAQHALAREYGCKSWAELMRVVVAMNSGADQTINVKRDHQPLPVAVRNRDLAEVQRLLAAGEFTPYDLDAGLAHAAWYGGDAPDVLAVRKAIFDLLIEHGADPDGQYGSGYGPVVLGCGECLSPEGLQWLVDVGCDVAFAPVQTKYGPSCPVVTWLGTYARGQNEKKHRGIEILLAKGAYVPPEVTPPILAIHRGDAGALGEMLDADRSLLRRRFADMPFGNIRLAGATLLHCAVEFGELACIDTILSRYRGHGDVDINAPADVIDGVGGQTPVYHAINTNGDGNFYTLEYLVRRVGQYIDMGVRATWRGSAGWAIRDFDPTKTPMTPLEYAEKAARDIDPKHAHFKPRAQDELRLLRALDRRALVRQACERGDVATVARMLDESPELLTPELWPAAIFKAKSLELTRLLLDRGLDPNLCSAPRKPLHLAADRGLVDVVELLLRRGADPAVVDGENTTPFELVAMSDFPNRERVLSMLRAAGADESIFTAIALGDDAGTLELLGRDASLVSSRGPIGFAPLDMAARFGRPRVVGALLAAGAAVDAANPAHNTALWLACQSGRDAAGRLEVARLLLDAGADPNRRCEHGTTPLHFAAWRGPVGMVELLQARGALAWITDDRGRTPADHAGDSDQLDAATRECVLRLLTGPRIDNPRFAAAVAAIDAGDLDGLRDLLERHPQLATMHAEEDTGSFAGPYFAKPALLWFVAGNPTRKAALPRNVCDMAEALIDAGATAADVAYTLGLAMTSSAAREQGLQAALMRTLMRRGATADVAAIDGTLAHRERAAVQALLDGGLPLTPRIAAGMGRTAELESLLSNADEDERQAALALAVINGELEAARLCLAAGADPNRHLVVHAHSLPVHQAAVNDDPAMLALLVEHGARLDVRDKMWNGTALGWAIHTKKPAAEAYLRSLGAP